VGPSFAYASYISDDPDRSAQVLGRLGVPVIWEGMHPFFGVPAIVCGTRDGSIMVLGPPDLESAHPAVARYRSARERMFHLAIRAGVGLSASDLSRIGELEVHGPYAGPCGETMAVSLPVGDSAPLWVELCLEVGSAGAAGSAFARVESVPMVGASLAGLRSGFARLGLSVVDGLDTALFPTLSARSEVIVLDQRTFIEFNEPAGEGPMATFLSRIGGAGIFGLSIEPDDLLNFVSTAHSCGVETNTDKPITLPVVVGGVEYAADDMVTVSPRMTGGARLFVVIPRDYPWKLLP